MQKQNINFLNLNWQSMNLLSLYFVYPSSCRLLVRDLDQLKVRKRKVYPITCILLLLIEMKMVWLTQKHRVKVIKSYIQMSFRQDKSFYSIATHIGFSTLVVPGSSYSPTLFQFPCWFHLKSSSFGKLCLCHMNLWCMMKSKICQCERSRQT